MQRAEALSWWWNQECFFYLHFFLFITVQQQPEYLTDGFFRSTKGPFQCLCQFSFSKAYIFVVDFSRVQRLSHFVALLKPLHIFSTQHRSKVHLEWRPCPIKWIVTLTATFDLQALTIGMISLVFLAKPHIIVQNVLIFFTQKIAPIEPYFFYINMS